MILSFSNWEIGFDQIGDLSTLKNLEYNLGVGNAAYDAGHWVRSLERTKSGQNDLTIFQDIFLGVRLRMTNNYLGSVENYQQR